VRVGWAGDHAPNVLEASTPAAPYLKLIRHNGQHERLRGVYKDTVPGHRGSARIVTISS
jgi:hypothetical protein